MVLSPVTDKSMCPLPSASTQRKSHHIATHHKQARLGIDQCDSALVEMYGSIGLTIFGLTCALCTVLRENHVLEVLQLVSCPLESKHVALLFDGMGDTPIKLKERKKWKGRIRDAFGQLTIVRYNEAGIDIPGKNYVSHFENKMSAQKMATRPRRRLLLFPQERLWSAEVTLRRR